MLINIKKLIKILQKKHPKFIIIIMKSNHQKFVKKKFKIFNNLINYYKSHKDVSIIIKNLSNKNRYQ
jgi:peptidoglycan/xylan/chitin deacetylase (PgdA/CDA1 family)